MSRPPALAQDDPRGPTEVCGGGLALALEDLEQAIAAAEAAAEKSAKPVAARKRQINRGALPPHRKRCFDLTFS
jgi:hypothetical protein